MPGGGGGEQEMSRLVRKKSLGFDLCFDVAFRRKLDKYVCCPSYLEGLHQTPFPPAISWER